jgi:putative endonuclease
MNFYVYVLFDKVKFYIGLTTNLKRRLREHLTGKVYSTKRYNQKELKLIFVEIFNNKKDARRRELYLKTTKGRKALRLMLRKSLNCGVV